MTAGRTFPPGSRASAPEMDAVVVGGGFFGCILAAHLGTHGAKVALIEREQDLLQRASHANQARVHHGYHYPRSLLTAFRSRVNYPRFRADFTSCICETFRHFYAIPRKFSKVNATQFRRFMEHVGAPIRPAPQNVRRLFDSTFIEEVFEVEECAFDTVKLKQIARERLTAAGVTPYLGAEVTGIHRSAAQIRITYDRQGTAGQVSASLVLNCTYSRINDVLGQAGLAPLRLKHEIAEMALVEVPEEIRETAFTVMCGPFFSLMPFPPLGLHTLSHVRYTPHLSWQEEAGAPPTDPYAILASYPKPSRFEHMRRDAARYIPSLHALKQRDSLWEVKTVLPQSEADDSRPILCRQADGEPRIWSIMGGKIDNIYDAIDELTVRGCFSRANS